MNTSEPHGLTRLLTSFAVFAVLVLTAGCSKSCDSSKSDNGTPTAVPPEPPTIAITGTPPPPASASALASASASPPAHASAKPPPVASSAPTHEGAPPKPLADKRQAASARIVGKNFNLEVGSPGCRVDEPCAVTLRLVAVGDWHVNKEYPYKFTAAEAPGVQFLGNGDAKIFSRASGAFLEEGEKTATMTVRFKPTSAGEARVAGIYKLSVCSAEQCQIEQQAVQLAVPVM